MRRDGAIYARRGQTGWRDDFLRRLGGKFDGGGVEKLVPRTPPSDIISVGLRFGHPSSFSHSLSLAVI